MGFIFNRGGIISPLIRTLAIALFMLTMVECVTRKAGRNSADKELRVRRAECDKDACAGEFLVKGAGAGELAGQSSEK